MPNRKKIRFIFVSGGVISGLGKGITTASIAAILQARGFKVAPIKCDAYINVDAGTIRPQEHGEVFVCDDGIETDQDLGNYERFIDQSLYRENYITTGQIYWSIIKKERNFEFNGEDVEVVPHVPEEMIRRFKEAGRKIDADFVIIEVGGTVGEYQNVLFIEANRIMKYRDKEDVIHVHVGYLPIPASIGEMKSKPVQTSVRILNGTGIQPDFIVCRAERPVDKPRRERIAWLCNIDGENVISNPDVDTIYKIPQIFEEQDFAQKILKKFNMPVKKPSMTKWNHVLKSIANSKKKITIGVVGKYFTVGDYELSDVYISVIEAIKHACWYHGVKPNLQWISSESIEKGNLDELKKLDCIIVPGGFGGRGTEGIISAIKFARENKVPYLGLCFGLQLAVIEYARHKLGLKDAHTTEINPQTKNPIIDIMADQKKKLAKNDYGGTMRLGSYPCYIFKDSLVYDDYKKYRPAELEKVSNDEKVTSLFQKKKPNDRFLIKERHRHRFEVNPEYHERLQSKGLILSGLSPDGRLVEFIELDKSDHPYFIATQAHPEFRSRPDRPHPLFAGLIEAALK
ncbi:MAG: hypothetical protein ACD_83C00019G0002 [uncultured bacterium]|nr:MAG: hypothetical protein ACD_83C00019G0002 [uncultured bacterium]